jgi:hypothetical protein
MLDILLEHPVTVGLTGATACAVAVFAWLQSAQKAALYTFIGLAALTIILVFISLQVVTDRERIESILYEVATAIEANDHEKVYSFIHPNAVDGNEQVRAELPRYKFKEAKVTSIKSIVVNSTKPPTAIAEFTVVVNGEFQGYAGKAGRFLRVYFMKRDERWLVHAYEHFDIQAAFTNNPLTTKPLEF